MRHCLLLILTLSLVACGPRSTVPKSPLEQALRKRNQGAVEKALADGADVNLALSDGSKPLEMAIRNHDYKNVGLLLDKGADYDLKDKKGRDLFEQLWNGGHLGTAEAKALGSLFKAGYTVPKTMDDKDQTWMHRLAQECNDDNIPKALVAQGFPVDERDEAGWTPLHHAVFNSRYHFCLGLLESGADVNAETGRELSRVIDDAEGGKGQLVYRYMAGSRPLDLEHQSFSRGQNKEDIAKLLEEKGGTRNPEVKNKF